ncbi:MAG: adenylate/guanylate cyclase domain-containing protein, partial [Spirochaetaceae bacterium]|nr:adenylate/guanylate cyclase domain-containing protein [Spirochaetaceae bacterium]
MEQKDYRLAAIMYTDIAGFSRMMESDEAGTLELLRFHNELIGEIVASHHGTVIKTIGDALLVDFKNTVEALQSALEIQDKLYAHNKEHAELPLLVRIGVHLGDIYFFENDALGEGINIAARLQSLARPGCICFSQDVYNLVLNKIEFRAEKLGKVSLKNITKEIHAYEITSPNVEFDPNRDKPRPGYKPGSYLGEGKAARPEADSDAEAAERAAADLPGGYASSSAPGSSQRSGAAGHGPAGQGAGRAVPPTPPSPPRAVAPGATAGDADAGDADPGEAPGLEADRGYSVDASRELLSEIRKSILLDIKAAGRRLRVDEALDRYGYYGVEAREVIATMADQGLLLKDRKAAPGSGGFGPGGFDADAFGKNLGAAVEGLVSEIGRGIERGMARADVRGRIEAGDRSFDPGDRRERIERHRERLERRMERRADRDAARSDETELETGKWDRKLRENDSWKPGEEERVADFERYRSALAERAKKQRGGFIGNLSSFLAVNGVLWFINLTTSAGFLWAAIVSGAWGIGLLSSAVAASRGSEKAREADSMPSLDRGQLETYKKLNRAKDSLAMHGASAVAVPLFLGLVNFMTGPDFLWFLIPSAALLFSYLSHLLSYRITRPRLERELLSSLGVEGGWKGLFRAGKAKRAAAADLGPYAGQYHEAERAKAAILSQVKAGSPVDEDLGPSLEAY